MLEATNGAKQRARPVSKTKEILSDSHVKGVKASINEDTIAAMLYGLKDQDKNENIDEPRNWKSLLARV